MDRYVVVPYSRGSEFWDIQTDKGRRINVKLEKETAEDICVELNAAWKDVARD